VQSAAPCLQLSPLQPKAPLSTLLSHYLQILPGKSTYWEKYRSQCHYVHHKSHMDRSGIDSGLPQ
jgi:hypothetical protein